ncbi:MAG: RNA-binding protein [Anaerovibrio sp.]|uniref:YlmH family RNA-binding protein n=1 Tax=Anaerovibrio sp. TaxID=1872532 RepID=UPI0025D7B67A|nr:YlmH/Sll1252 family protein [Anaerovibrio sp.]MCR5175967.1 RNA-binding protein [Anaerovibrio sp.]
MAGSEQRDKLIRFYKGTEGAETAVKLVDMAERVKRNQRFQLSGFLDPYGQEIAETIVANYPGIRVDFSGGYPGAERQRAMFMDESFGGNPGFDIVVLKATWNGQFEHLGHRDVLGALMGLGIQRDCLGDIIMSGASALILAESGMGTFLMDNLTMIGRSGVTCVEDELSNIAPKEERCKEIQATVASLRVDSIAAAGYGSSRSRAASDIAADKLKLNWQPVKNASQSVKEGDILSMRGRGRIEVVEVRGKTKKGRIGVLLKKYI